MNCAKFSVQAVGNAVHITITTKKSAGPMKGTFIL